MLDGDAVRVFVIKGPHGYGVEAFPLIEGRMPTYTQANDREALVPRTGTAPTLTRREAFAHALDLVADRDDRREPGT